MTRGGRFSLALPLMVALLAVPVAPPALANVPRTVDVIELRPIADAEFTVDGDRYRGRLEIDREVDGLSLVEHVPIDRYLAGVREVPFSWPADTLAAQAVAARTYLAWTLQRGRAGAGRTYGFDICATTACQVYRGSAVAAGADGDRWLAAIERTAGEILVADGAPAQTLYSSSAGRRTLANQDVWAGEPKFYLQPVDSPEQGVTPYESWTVRVSATAFTRILARAGFAPGGEVRSVAVERPAEGEGPSHLEVETERGVLRIQATTVRWLMNQHGPRLYPGLLPGPRPDGRRWPQAILSYSFDASLEPAAAPRPFDTRLPRDDRATDATVVFTGEGWGHGVGMSQWGAKALGDAGVDYAGILAHYYGGLRPQDGDGYLPETVAVGLDWGRGEIVVDADGGFDLLVDGLAVDVLPAGEWVFRATPVGIAIVPPPGVRGGDRRFNGPWPR